jgi:hypothetical protein
LLIAGLNLVASLRYFRLLRRATCFFALAAAQGTALRVTESAARALTLRMVRTRSQRAAMLLRLPTDVLFKIASHVVAPDLVVAAGKSLEARTALRKGTDAAERSRFGGIGLTIKEAEHRLRGPYMLNEDLEASDLETRRAAGFALLKAIRVTYRDDELAIALIAYGADVNATSPRFGYTLLHMAYKASFTLRLARILIAAGADLDARCGAPNGAGLSPLAWCIECGEGTERSYALASFFIEQGCDVVQADADFAHQTEHASLLAALEGQPTTPAKTRLMESISLSLETAEPARRQAAVDAARRLPTQFGPTATAAHGLM